jgi:hypothetical protein
LAPQGVNRQPDFLVPLGDQRKPWFILVAQRFYDGLGVIPEGFGLFKVDSMLLCVGVALGGVVFELHFSGLRLYDIRNVLLGQAFCFVLGFLQA